MTRHEVNYFGRVNQRLADLVPTSSRRILEIGCGSGALAEHLCKRIPDAHYVGVELESDVAEPAKRHANRIVVGNAEEIPNSALVANDAGNFDCIIYGDVLEHLIDPWSTLKRHAEMLAPNGVVVASIPNIQYWKVVGSILTDSWKYQDHGSLDRGHLRWFTRSAVADLFHSSNLQVEAIWPVYGNASGFDTYFDAMRSVLTGWGADSEEFRKLSLAVQFLVRAKAP